MREDDYSALCSLGLRVSRETYELLKAYQTQFEIWNRKINLAAPSTIGSFWERHVLDSAQIFFLANNSNGSWVDLGSGGGLPGMVIAILAKGSSGEVALVESNTRKTGFLHSVNAAFGGPARIVSQRIEDAVIHVKQPDFITARALAPLDDLLSMAFPLFGKGTRAFFPKGRGYRREVEESRRNWTFNLIEHPSVIDDESVILEISQPERR